MALKVAQTSDAWTGTSTSRHQHGPLYGGSSLVFDMEVESDEQAPSQRPCSHVCDLNALSQRLAYFARPHGDFAQKLLQDVRTYKQVVLHEESSLDIVVLATKMSNVGYHVHVRTALGGGDACFKNLRHEFLVVRGTGDFDQYEYIVEPQLREHFQIPHPTSTYLAILDLVPQEFVGTVSSLTQVVQVLCHEMANSFASRGLTLPPWRRVDSLLSKWVPVKAKDTTLASDSHRSSGARTAAAAKLHGSWIDRAQQPRRTSVPGLTVKPPSAPGLLPVYSVQFGFAPHVA